MDVDEGDDLLGLLAGSSDGSEDGSDAEGGFSGSAAGDGSEDEESDKGSEDIKCEQPMTPAKAKKSGLRIYDSSPRIIVRRCDVLCVVV
jgi:hypothetical protein